MNVEKLKANIQTWALELGIQAIGVTDLNVSTASQHLKAWLEKQFHGDMLYMERHADLRTNPESLHPGSIRVLSARMNYLPEPTQIAENLRNPSQAYVSRYALGKDYHKLFRKRLARLANKISDHIDDHQYRVFCDSAPVLERGLAEKSGIGWIGKNTMLLNKEHGSWFFLGEIFTNLPLPLDQSVANECGACKACLEICPTDAFVAPYQLDARRCISYLTIEYDGIIEPTLAKAMGNRIYGCDDCQLICPWNRFAEATEEQAFLPLNKLDNTTLLNVFSWTEKQFLDNFAGSPIRRIGYQRWVRNIAIALGNAPQNPTILTALRQKLADKNLGEMVREQIQMAIDWHLLVKVEEAGKTKKLIRAIRKLRPGEQHIDIEEQ